MRQGQIKARCLTGRAGAIRWGSVYKIIKGEWGAAGMGDMEDDVLIGTIDEVTLEER